MTIPLLGIVADDLTGAMDTSGVFASRGLKSTVALAPGNRFESATCDILCYNTQSRFLTESDAVDSVKAATRSLITVGCARLYKKIDSTLRGYVGAEIAAMVREAKVKTAFVCPAFPGMGRTVKHGVAYVNEMPLSEAQEGKDVFAGVSTSSVTELLSKQSGVKTGLVDVSVYQDESGIEDRVSYLLEDGCEIIVFDATRDEHLALILSATERLKNESILVGSAGMASAVALSLAGDETTVSDALVPKFSPHPVVIVSGSLNKVTQTQLNALSKVSDLNIVPIDSSSVLGPESSMNDEVQTVSTRARSALEGRKDAVLMWDNPDALETAIVEAVDSSWMIERISDAIDSIMTAVVDGPELSGLILIGGETAYAVLNALEANAIEVSHEVLSGVPFGTILGGLADGKFVITKAGGFGDENTLVSAINYVRQLRSL